MNKKLEEQLHIILAGVLANGFMQEGKVNTSVIDKAKEEVNKIINKCLAEQAKEMIGEAEVTDCDDGYKTGVSKTGKRLSHNGLIGYNIKNKEIIEIAKKYNI